MVPILQYGRKILKCVSIPRILLYKENHRHTAGGFDYIWTYSILKGCKDDFTDLGRIDLYRDLSFRRSNLIGNPYIFVGVAEGMAAASAVYSHNIKGHTGICQSNRQIHIAAVIEEINVHRILRTIGPGCQLCIGTVIDMEPKLIAP